LTAITAKPKTWEGIEFRSTLEADWAATLTSLGITWEYEPEILTMSDGNAYIPDFWLPEIGTWIEVKGYGVGREWKPAELAQEKLCHCTGKCECRWYGGLIVLIGREAREHGTRLAWDDALGCNAYLCQCTECGAWSWRRIRHSLRCRKCGQPANAWTAGLNASGDMPFRRAWKDPWQLAMPAFLANRRGERG